MARSQEERIEGQGLVSVERRFSVKETIDRLAAGAERVGLLVLARIDHSDNAAQIGVDLRPTELLLFGHPKGGPRSCRTSRAQGSTCP